MKLSTGLIESAANALIDELCRSAVEKALIGEAWPYIHSSNSN